jgi:hypothetical protein
VEIVGQEGACIARLLQRLRQNRPEAARRAVVAIADALAVERQV